MTRALGSATLAEFEALARNHAGIDVASDKRSLIEARIRPRMRALGMATPRDYLKVVLADPDGQERQHFIDAIATNVTGFFREPDHFEHLYWVLRARVQRGARRLRLWSAACSTGQEPYSMAMVAADAASGQPVDVAVLATDISSKALAEARAGRYEERDVAPVPLALRHAHLRRCGDARDRTYEVGPVRGLVTFESLNLVAPPYPVRGPFDVIFCRNVLIYFNRETRVRVLTALARLLDAEGILVVGHAEALTGLPVPLAPVTGTIYRRA
ncbi:MAG: protein-glutamate O-methyltransferase CheR [Kofleriaceae bacterium]|nr:protein-glutamate O-methyltransferase CheR [Kofleriaceae bacterium]MBP6841928.1 protein-glutamate O-methyltransferase CheR [Kofleriaceae bacterium]MBP9204744.1 protein-glutamate O-methyltransferase CheR [Kofleriaceae bacterium]